MNFGISTLSRSLYTSREAYMTVAQAAEQAGFDFMSVNDHIIVPTNLGSAVLDTHTLFDRMCRNGVNIERWPIVYWCP